MKSLFFKKAICLLALSLTANFTFSQESKLWVRFDNPGFLPHFNSDGRLLSTSEDLNDLISVNNMTGFIQVLPNSKSENLQNVYEVSFLGNELDVTNSLSKLPFIGLVEEAPNYQVLYTPDDYNVTLGADYALNLINAQGAWDISQGSDSVVIAISDQNYYQHHEELQGKIVYYDSTNLTTATHGTAIAILAAGNTNNGIGFSSIGFKCKLALYKMSFNEILVASYNGADVINLSWTSGCFYSQIAQDVINEAYNNGTFIVASAGNGNTCGGADNIVFPASYANVFAVTSVGPTDNHESIIGDPLSTHQHNLSVDISAPGYGVNISAAPNWYFNSSGTSYAAAYVSGTVGLMLSVNKCITNADIEMILKLSSHNIDSLNPLYAGKLGAGRLDAQAALVMTGSHIGDFTSTSTLSDGCIANDVSINSVSSGGQLPYSFSWSNGSSTLNLDSIGAGNINLIISDAHGCSVNHQFNVVDIQEPVVDIQITNVSCFGDNNGQVELVFSNPSEVSSVIWDNGASGSVINNLPLGSYTATIFYNNGNCSLSQAASVLSPTALSISAATIDVDSLNAGSIDITVVGGTAPYLYNWDNNEQSEDIANLIAGVYSVSVMDAAGCSFATFYEIFEDTTQQSAGVVETINFAIHAYPNPSNGDVTISWTGELISLELINASGQCVSRHQNFPTNSIQLNSIGTGVYFARYYAKDQVAPKTLKLVVL
ncbi:MAG: S8 family serine peptidase [Flavobacteriia bacterium]|nr:S8 family serine peptidase [Flavobacteriia bacterium]